MNINEILMEKAQLMVVKAAVDSLASVAKEMLTQQLEEMGIEAEIEININTVSVNLETLKNASKRRRSYGCRMDTKCD